MKPKKSGEDQFVQGISQHLNRLEPESLALEFSERIKCGRCDGTLVDPYTGTTCGRCHGEGHQW